MDKALVLLLLFREQTWLKKRQEVLTAATNHVERLRIERGTLSEHRWVQCDEPMIIQGIVPKSKNLLKRIMQDKRSECSPTSQSWS